MVGVQRVEGMMTPTTSEYEMARARLMRRRKFRGEAFTYVVINLALVVLWAATGMGYFWPGWVMAGWGTLLLLGAWDAYMRRDVTEDDIQRELHKTS